MTPVFKKHGAAMIWVFTAIAMVASALLLKDSQYENAWLWILCVGIALASVWEVYSKKNKGKK